jgi:gamma-glutamyltranspeptidase/glutathione hydrolase
MAISFTSTAAYGQVSRGDGYSGALWATRSPVIAQHGMTATEQRLASALAIDILKKGVGAVDAANAAIGLMQPVLNGIGGYLFAIVWDPKTKQVYGYNGSGRSAKGRDLAKLTAEVEAAWKKAEKPYQAYIPHVRLALHHGARHRGCVVRVA